MKYKGSRCEIAEERDAELLRAYKSIIEVRDKISLSEVVHTLAQTSCSRFFVSEERAYNVICNMLRNTSSISHMIPLRKEMYQEIFHRFVQYQEEHPSLTRKECVWRVCHQPAPKFYLTPKSIVTILHRVRKEAKKRCYEQRKRKLRFMLGTL